MSFILINQRLSNIIILIKRSVVNKPNINLSNQLKSFNDLKQYKKTLQLFDENQIKNNEKTCSRSTLFHVLKASIELQDMKFTSNIQQMITTKFNNDPYLLTSLINLHMQCGDVDHGELIFNSLTNRNISVYGVMMQGYIKNKQAKKAIDLFKQIKNPDDIIYTLLMKAYAQIASKDQLNSIKNVLETIPQSLYSNTYFLTSLINAFAQSGDVEAAKSIFDSTKNQSIESYGALIKGYITNNEAKKAIELFKQIKHPNHVIYILFLNACAQLGTNESLNSIKKISKNIPQTIYSNEKLLTSLIDALAKCGDIESAQTVFYTSKTRTAHMCNALMKGFVINNQMNKAIDVFQQIKNPGDITYTILFNACAQLASDDALIFIKNIMKNIPQSFRSNRWLTTSLIDALAKCGDMTSAQAVFDSSSQRNIELYGALMKGYLVNNQAEKAIAIFEDIKDPDVITATISLNACAQLGSSKALSIINNTLKRISQSFYSNEKFVTSLVDALGKCGDMTSAQAVFDSSSHRNIELYGALMKGYIINNQAEKALEVFKGIKKGDVVIYILFCNACAQVGSNEALNLINNNLKSFPKSFYSNGRFVTALLDAFVKCDDLASAQLLFDSIKEKTTEIYTVIMNGLNKDDQPEKTIELFKQMEKNNIERDLVLYLCLIKALAKVGVQSLSQSMIEHIPGNFLSTNEIQTALVDMWGRNASIVKAKESFENLSQPTDYGYAAMINAYGLNGMGSQALHLYQQTPSNFIDEITHLCVLNACSHSGFVNEARSIFNNIPVKTEKIYVTMIDCLSRASFFEEAQYLIEQYEQTHSPSLVMYMSFLSGTRNQKNSQLAQQTYDRMRKCFPQSKDLLTSGSTLLANVYQATGDLEKAFQIRHQMTQSGLKKKSGLSWTAVNGQIYRFRAHDRSHPRSAEIHAEGKKISDELISCGYQHDSSWITRPLNEDETDASVLCGHSERLAIAWNFVVNPNASQIQLTKNLRVCGDCHRATKYIAAIRQCEIIVRDANRIHHFQKNGQCSCNDYF